jgi:hypothetical protein
MDKNEHRMINLLEVTKFSVNGERYHVIWKGYSKLDFI